MTTPEPEERLTRERRDELIDASNRSLERARKAEEKLAEAIDMLRQATLCMNGGDMKSRIRLFIEQNA